MKLTRKEKEFLKEWHSAWSTQKKELVAKHYKNVVYRGADDYNRWFENANGTIENAASIVDLDEVLIQVLRATNNNVKHHNENTAITGMAQLYTE